MDKNKLIRLLLMSASLLVYLYFFKPKPEVQPAPLPVNETTSPLTSPSTSNGLITSPFSAALKGEEKYITVENELFKVILSTKGGTIKKVILKKYQDKHKRELVLLDDQSSSMGLSFPYQNLLIETKGCYFQTKTKTKPFHMLQGDERVTIIFRLEFAPSQYLDQLFEFSGNSYQVKYAYKAVGMEPYLTKASHLTFCWNMDMKSLESDTKADLSKSTVNYYLLDDHFGHLKETSTEIEKKQIIMPIKWVSIKQRFFSSAIISDGSFAAGDISIEPLSSKKDVTKIVRLSLALSDTHKESGMFTFFFGPNDYTILQKVTKGFEQNIPLGWVIVKWVNQGLIIPLFSFLENYFSNYGIIIFLLVIVIKLLLVPLSYKSFIAMAKMKLIKPELDKIKEKYGHNLQKVQSEQMAFYRELGINPLSGCMPILLQMPILLAMFNFFPNALALRHASFLWANDLSTYDSVIQLPFTIPIYGSHVSLFTLLMVGSTILYTWSSNQSSPTEGPMKGLSYIMPITFMFVLNSFPAGLSFYYCISNLTTFLQQKIIGYFVDEESIKEKLLATKNKVKKGGKPSFQSIVAATIQEDNKKKK